MTDPAATRLLDLIAVRDALRMSGHVVSGDPAQLAGQLIGRLAPVRSPGVARLLAGACNRRGAPWFRPLTPSLVAVGGPLRMTLTGHTGWVGGTAISPDGRIAVSAGDDTTVRVWDLEHGSCLQILSGHAGPVRGVAVSADGRTAVSGGDDGTVRAWNLEEGREVCRLEGDAGPVRAVALAADGRIAVSGGDDGRVRVWDLASSRQLHVLPGHEGKVRGVAISGDGRIVVSGGDDATIAVWDLHRAEMQASTYAQRVWCVAVDGAGSTVVWGLHDYHLVVWELRDGAKPTERAGHGGPVRAVAVTPDGTTIVSGSDDRTVRVWGRAEEEAQILGEHGAAVGGVAVDAAGQVAVSGSGDGAVIVWDLNRGPAPRMSVEPMQQAPDFGVEDVVVTPDGTGAVSRGTDGTIKTWDLTRWTQTGELRDPHDLGTVRGRVLALLPTGAVDVAFDPERRIRIVRVWDLESGVLVRRLEASEAPIDALASSSDGRFVFAGRHDGRLMILDLVAGAHTRVAPGHRSAINDITVTQDGRRVLTASSDGSVGVWDASSWDRAPRTLGETGPAVTAIAAMPDSRHAVAGYVDGTVALWDLDDGVDVVRSGLHRAMITSLVALPDGRTVVSTGLDGTVRAWWPMRPDRTSPAFTGQTAMLCAAVTPDGAVIVAGEKSGRIHPLRLIVPIAGSVSLTHP